MRNKNFRNLLTAIMILPAAFCGVTAAAQTVTTFDILAATETLTVVGTTTLLGNAFSVGTSTLVIDSGAVAIGTTSLQGTLHVVSKYGTTHKPEILFFQSAFREGIRSSSEWDPINMADDSVAMGGSEQLANGSGSAIIGGGSHQTSGSLSFIGGGNTNLVDAGGPAGGIIGGSDNGVDGSNGFIGGGAGNYVGAIYASAVGGDFTFATGTGSFAAGGLDNTASGKNSTALGGVGNIASGEASFAAGNFANATAKGSFVWGDSQGLDFISTSTDEFKVRAQGGFVFYSTWAAPTVIVSSGAIMISTSATAAAAVPNIFISSTNGRVGIGTKTPGTTLDVAGNVTALSSVTASAFFGDGSHLTGVPAGDVTAAGSNAFTGANTEAGAETFLANSTLTLNSGAYMSVASTAVYTQYIDSNTTPSKNGLYPLVIPKALAEFSSTTSSVTVYTAFNVSSISRTAIGEYTVTMMNAMLNTSYIIFASVESSANNTDGVSCIPRKRGDKTTTTFKLRCFDNSFTPQDPGNGASFVVFGTQ